MPRASDGTYTAPVNDWNPPVNGALIDPVGWEAQLADYVTAFTASLDRSGNGGMLADLKVLANAEILTEISSPTAPPALNLKLYALHSGGLTKLAYKDSAGTETVLGAAGGLTVGSTTITSGTTTRILYDNAGVLGEYTITGSGTVVAMAAGPTFTAPVLGVATATSLNGNTFTTGTYTLTGVAGKTLTFSNTLTFAGTDATTMTFPPASASIGYLNIPQNSQSTAYTTVLADSGKHILHPTADNNARTFTIDSNANVAYPVGTAITFINQINTVTIAITADTLTLNPGGTTGSRTLAASGMATAVKVAATVWVISGVGLT